MQFKDAMNNMFGFIVKQPIHHSLRQMRLVHVFLILSSQWMLWQVISKLEHLDKMQAAMAYTAIAGSFITAIWKAVDGLHKKNHHDDD